MSINIDFGQLKVTQEAVRTANAERVQQAADAAMKCIEGSLETRAQKGLNLVVILPQDPATRQPWDRKVSEKVVDEINDSSTGKGNNGGFACFVNDTEASIIVAESEYAARSVLADDRVWPEYTASIGNSNDAEKPPKSV